MSAGEIHVGDIGIPFIITLLNESSGVVDISEASTKQFIFEKPDQTLLTVPGVFASGGTDGQLKYVTASGDLNQSGGWKYQMHVIIGSQENYSDIGKFKVFPNLPL